MLKQCVAIALALSSGVCAMADNASLGNAKKAKKDEFYTQLSDINNELRHYTQHFEGKVVLCNCDDPYESNFFKYFAANFNSLKLKRLIATCYSGSPIAGTQLELDFGEESSAPSTIRRKVAHKIVINEVPDVNGDGRIDLADVEWLIKNKKNILTELKEGGDFRSKECVELLNEADIVVTNPPFSLFREFVAQLVKYDKKFLIIGHQNAIHYKEIFPLIRDNKMWLGYGFKGNAAHFINTCYEDYATASDHKAGMIRVSGVTWFTNLDHKKHHESYTFIRRYKPEYYPRYANYDAIDVSKAADIPEDWEGFMGVPDTFIEKYNPEQFELIGNAGDTEWAKEAGVLPMGAETISRLRKQGNKAHVTANMRSLYLDVDGKVKLPYSRIIIRRKK